MKIQKVLLLLILCQNFFNSKAQQMVNYPGGVSTSNGPFSVYSSYSLTIVNPGTILTSTLRYSIQSVNGDSYEFSYIIGSLKETITACSRTHEVCSGSYLITTNSNVVFQIINKNSVLSASFLFDFSLSGSVPVIGGAPSVSKSSNTAARVTIPPATSTGSSPIQKVYVYAYRGISFDFYTFNPSSTREYFILGMQCSTNYRINYILENYDGRSARSGNATYTHSCVTYCYGIASDSPTVCSGKGSCSETDVCVCNTGYTGAQCQISTQITCYGVSDSSPSVCSGQGKCISKDVCQCNNGYSGNQCQTALTYNCFGLPSTSPNVCSGSGSCVGTNSCSCYSNYKGTKCEFSSLQSLTVHASFQICDTSNSYGLIVANSSCIQTTGSSSKEVYCNSNDLEQIVTTYGNSATCTGTKSTSTFSITDCIKQADNSFWKSKCYPSDSSFSNVAVVKTFSDSSCRFENPHYAIVKLNTCFFKPGESFKYVASGYAPNLVIKLFNYYGSMSCVGEPVVTEYSGYTGYGGCGSCPGGIAGSCRVILTGSFTLNQLNRPTYDPPTQRDPISSGKTRNLSFVLLIVVMLLNF